MTRNILDESRIHPSIRATISNFNADIVREVQAAVAAHAIVVVGMSLNPFPRKARKLLDRLGAQYQYLEYGSYFSHWRPRSALKLWTGWPTFPMIFINGTLVGGAQELQKLVDQGEFARMVGARASA
ncbi:glutaredoxin [Oxalobacteraceae bacterium A2-2]